MIARVLFALFAACFALTASASAQSFNAQEQAEIRAVVRDYLIKNPDVLREALDALEAQARSERRVKIERDPRDFSLGPADAPVVVVEFFDYRCPFCLSALPWMIDMVRTRRDVRFVFKELPLDIHGEPALEASRASIAAMPQGRYWQFHQALLSHRGDLTSEAIDRLARQSGIDVARMRARMSSAEVTRVLQDTRALAVDSQVDGTPAFFINGTLVSGFRQEELETAIRTAAREARLRRTAAN